MLSEAFRIMADGLESSPYSFAGAYVSQDDLRRWADMYDSEVAAALLKQLERLVTAIDTMKREKSS